ncbi:MAG: GTP-binding protein [Candidatus Lokiarchaeota archaeon]|nr:GTP-binding protein [Candidatus Lokiarchaeota archaeon]
MANSDYQILDRSISTDALYKIVVLGDGFVGKTGITVRFCEGQFKEEYKMTIGVNFGSKKIKYNDKSYALQLWDIAGQQRFKLFRTQYYNGAVAVILVYDVTNKLTFKDLPNWISEFQEKMGSKPVIVVGNKVDLPESGEIDPRTKQPYTKEVSSEEGKEFAESINATFFETSAKTNLNIDNLFIQTINAIEGKLSSKIKIINTYNSIENGFEIIEEIIKSRQENKLYDALIRLKQSIFVSNPYSVVLGNITEWMIYLLSREMTNDIEDALIKSISAWKLYYNHSLQEGQAVQSSL